MDQLNNIVMFHSGSTFPSHLKFCLQQLFWWNPNTRVWFLTDKGHKANPMFKEFPNMVVVNKDNFITPKISTFQELYKKDKDDFWTITATRLMYIEELLRTYGLNDVYHIENDVLLYYDISKHHSLFTQLYRSLAITVGGPDKAMTGLLFIKDSFALSRMTEFFITLLSKNPLGWIRDNYSCDMVNEMTLMRIYQKEKGESELSSLPILPFGPYSKDADKFNSIFDPASWGQFVGGTTDGIPGAKPEDHYIGQLLRENASYKVVWKDEDHKKVPYFRYGSFLSPKEVRINNLHIHSKNLHKYLSYE
jgi:hypothetical protein